MTTKTDLLATRVEGIRPAVPAANSSDANTNALHTDIAAAEDMIDTHAAPVKTGLLHNGMPGFFKALAAATNMPALADQCGDATDMIPDNGQSRRTAGATAAALARVQCVCGNPTPTDAIDGAIRAEAVVREFARLAYAECEARLAVPLHPTTPTTGDESEWTAYATASRVYAVADRRWTEAINARLAFATANLPALRAALGGVA